MQQKKELSIIIIGNVHTDFTLAPSLTKLFISLHKKKIPFVFLEEAPSDQSLQNARESTISGMKQSSIFRQIVPQLLPFYKTIKSDNLVYQHLEKAAFSGIKNIVKTIIMPMIEMDPRDENMAEQITTEFFRENAYREEIKLYEKLMQLNIPYAGIDLPSALYGVTLLAGTTNPEKFVENESCRINAMVENTFKNMGSLPSSGLMFITTGTTHSHRLAAKIFLEHKNNKFHTEGHTINIHPFTLDSFCVADWNQDNYGLEITRKADTTELLDVYNMLPSLDAYSKQENNGFSIPAIEDLVDDFISTHLAVKHSLSPYSMFSNSPHDLLVKEIKEYCNQNPAINKDSFMRTIEEDKDYSLALRKFCALGNQTLVQLLINYNDRLPIDFYQKSSNGKTALDWLENAKINSAERNFVKNMLLEKMEGSAGLTLQ